MKQGTILKYFLHLILFILPIILNANSDETEFINKNSILISFSIILVFATIFLLFNNSFYKTEKIYSEKEKDKFKMLLKYASDGVHIIDFNGNLVDCSDSFCKSLGYKYDELLSQNVTLWDNSFKLEEIENIIETILKEEELVFRTKHKRKDGTTFDVEINAKSMLINNTTYIYASSRDITRSLKLEKEIQKERDLLNNLFDNVEAIVATIKPDGTMNRVNKFTEDLTGYTQEEISSKPYFWFDKFIPSTIKPDIKNIIESFDNKDMISKKENEWICKNGELRLFEWSNKIIYEGEKPSYLLTVGIDITDRKRLENELVEFNNKLENRVIEATKELNQSLSIIEENVISSKTDLNGIITQVTKKFCEVSKYSEEELIGRNHNIVRHEDTPKEVFTELWQQIKSGKTWHGRIKNKNKNGEPYWVDSTISPMYDENGKHIGYFSYRVDVTQEVKNEELQKKHNEELESKVKEQLQEIRDKDLKMLEQAKMASLGEMLTNIAHQWRQPLNLISVCSTGVSYSLDFGGIDKEEIRSNLKYIDDSTKFLTKTIETFSNYLNGDKEFKEIPIEEEISTSKYIVESSLKSDNINIIDEIDYNNKNYAYLVENELSQVLINLFNNAQYALVNNNDVDNRWIKISNKIDDEKYTIIVEDNAGGIPDSVINKIFEPYFTTKFKSQGTGLGLSMSYRIMNESIKGNISVKNSENGAVFYLEIPLFR